MPLPTSATPIPRASARSTVLERLTGWIEDGVLEPGEVIRDAEIARQLGVSRTPVREALQILEQQGAIESVPGRYTRVATAAPEDARLVYPPLSALQALAAELATPRSTAGDVAAMVSHNEGLIEAVRRDDPLAARDCDTAFHRVLVERAANPHLTSTIDHLLIHVRRLEALFFRQVGPAERSYEQHRDIVEAVRRGDAEAATRLTRENFLRHVP